jgi:hypothetical protein
LRTDWHLPPNVTALFGRGNSLVATAKTAAPAATSTTAPAVSASASRPASIKPSTKPSVTPSVKPSATPAPTATTTTWWWSATGVTWQPSGLQTNSASWEIVDGQILIYDPPATAAATATATPTAKAKAKATATATELIPADWTVWSSVDGKSWQHPSSNPVSFAASKACVIAWRDDLVVIVGWDTPSRLKDYTGNLVTQ